MDEKYLIKRRDNAKNRIEHLGTVSTAPTPVEVYEKYGTGKYVVFMVKKGVKGIRKFASFGIDKDGKIVEGTTPLAKKDTTQGIPKRSLELAEKGIKKGVEVAKKTPEYIKKATPSISCQRVLIKSEFFTRNGKKVRKDFYKHVPITEGVPSEAKKEKTIEDKKLEEEKLEKELQKTIVPVDPEEQESKESLPYIILTLIGIGAIFFGISAYQQS